MEKILLLDKGEIILTKEKITIRDEAKKQKLIRIGSALIWMLYGTLCVFRYRKTGDEFLLWSGIIIGLLHLTALAYSLFITAKADVMVQEISSAIFKSRYGNKFLDLKLKGGLKRRISKVEPIAEELRAFLIEKKIAVK